MSNVLVEERGRSANFQNPARRPFERVRVDDCLITDGIRADWIVRKIGYATAIVELKGKDIEHAFEQLLATYAHSHCRAWMEKRSALVIVSSRVPAISKQIVDFKEEARRKGTRLTVINTRLDCEMEKLFQKYGED